MNEPLPPAQVADEDDRPQINVQALSRGIRQTLLTQANAWLDISESLEDAELAGLPADVVKELGQVSDHLAAASRFGLSAAIKLMRKG